MVTTSGPWFGAVQCPSWSQRLVKEIVVFNHWVSKRTSTSLSALSFRLRRFFSQMGNEDKVHEKGFGQGFALYIQIAPAAYRWINSAKGRDEECVDPNFQVLSFANVYSYLHTWQPNLWLRSSRRDVCFFLSLHRWQNLCKCSTLTTSRFSILFVPDVKVVTFFF